MNARRAVSLGTAILVAACDGAQVRVDHALQRMRRQPRAEAYGASGVFADGMVMRAPPPGTVAREAQLDSAGAPAVTPALLARGSSRYGIYCAVCHGAGGWGGSVVGSNMVEHRPPPLRSGMAAELSPAEIYSIIRIGKGVMPAYATDLTVAERWAVADYVVSLRGRAALTPAERDDSARAVEVRYADSLYAAQQAPR